MVYRALITGELALSTSWGIFDRYPLQTWILSTTEIPKAPFGLQRHAIYRARSSTHTYSVSLQPCRDYWWPVHLLWQCRRSYTRTAFIITLFLRFLK